MGVSNALSFSGGYAFTDQFSLGFSTGLDLRDSEVPLDRRLQSGSVSFDYHSLCYGLNLTYQESVVSTFEGTNVVFASERKVVLSFRLSGLSRSIGTQEEFFIR